MSSVIRSVKNVTKGYSSVQVKVRNATSNDPWGPTGADMADIARITYNSSTDFYEVMDMLDKRLNDKGKNWRHVLKSLKVLDYCLHEGSELVVTWARKNIYLVKTLREFYYVDDDGRDVGASIRQSAKELTSLILDEERLRAERANRGSWKSRVTGLEDLGGAGAGAGASSVGANYEGSNSARAEARNRRRQDNNDNDLEMRLALEASKNEAESDAIRRATLSGDENDADFQKALKLSQEEEERRRRQLEDQKQEDLLFDDTPGEQVPQATGFNQGYQQQPQVDWFGNVVNAQQPQQTGFLNNAYSQPTGQPFQNGYGGGFGYNQPQQPAYEQLQQPAQQFIQTQNTYNPWAQQMNGGLGSQQQQPPAQPASPEPVAQPGSNNPWATSNTAHNSALSIQPTGSNNPFAIQRPQQSHTSFSKAPTLSTLQEQAAANQFNSRPNPITNYSTPALPVSTPPPLLQSQTPPTQARISPPPQDPYQAKLNALLASGDGQDTFGNVGDLRIPAQHTAPGTFVNSAGGGSMGRLESSRTGTNPFFTQNTAAQVQFPAQTGPATGFGGSPNPFGPRPPGQPAQQSQQGGSLIDF